MVLSVSVLGSDPQSPGEARGCRGAAAAGPVSSVAAVRGRGAREGWAGGLAGVPCCAFAGRGRAPAVICGFTGSSVKFSAVVLPG